MKKNKALRCVKIEKSMKTVLYSMKELNYNFRLLHTCDS